MTHPISAPKAPEMEVRQRWTNGVVEGVDAVVPTARNPLRSTPLSAGGFIGGEVASKPRGKLVGAAEPPPMELFPPTEDESSVEA